MIKLMRVFDWIVGALAALALAWFAGYKLANFEIAWKMTATVAIVEALGLFKWHCKRRALSIFGDDWLAMVPMTAAALLGLVWAGVPGTITGFGIVSAVFISYALFGWVKSWLRRNNTRHKLAVVNLIFGALSLASIITGGIYLRNAVPAGGAIIMIATIGAAFLTVAWLLATSKWRGQVKAENEETARSEAARHDRDVASKARRDERQELLDERSEAARVGAWGKTLRETLGCPALADAWGSFTRPIATVFYLMNGGVSRLGDVDSYLKMRALLDKKDKPGVALVMLQGPAGSGAPRFFLAWHDNAPLWHIVSTGTSYATLRDFAGLTLQFPFHQTAPENAEAILNFVSTHSSVADATIHELQRLAIPALVWGDDSKDLEGLRGLIEEGTRVFAEEGGHPIGDSELTLEHVRLAHSFRSRAEARAASSPPPAG